MTTRLLLTVVFVCAVCAAQSSTTVTIGGTGPSPHLQTVLDGVSDMLSANGVTVKIAAGDSKSRNVILDEMKASGSTLLLYIQVHQVKGQRGKILAQSFADGKPVWEEEVRGSLMAMSAEGEVRKMLKAINDKLKSRIGRTGLPKP